MVTQTAPAAVEKRNTEADPRKIVKRVIVHWMNAAEGNQNQEITVNDLGMENGRKSFYPGQEIDLTMTQIGILKDAVERMRVDIPIGSGAYESDNPIRIVQQQYPGFQVKRRTSDGMIYAERIKPNYSIVEVDKAL